jgi:hypothetical protein
VYLSRQLKYDFIRERKVPQQSIVLDFLIWKLVTFLKYILGKKRKVLLKIQK